MNEPFASIYMHKSKRVRTSTVHYQYRLSFNKMACDVLGLHLGQRVGIKIDPKNHLIELDTTKKLYMVFRSGFKGLGVSLTSTIRQLSIIDKNNRKRLDVDRLGDKIFVYLDTVYVTPERYGWKGAKSWDSSKDVTIFIRTRELFLSIVKRVAVIEGKNTSEIMRDSFVHYVLDQYPRLWDEFVQSNNLGMIIKGE
ncbi:MAG: hypothetical protein ACE5GV_09920 [Candidatus Scalindua sp.]